MAGGTFQPNEQGELFYELHRWKDRSYMIIALPLPWSSMIKVLEFHQIDHELQLSS